MKLTRISVELWNNHNGCHTYLRRYYTNPAVEQVVVLGLDEVTTSLIKDHMHQASKQGIQHLKRPL